jgi:hypothetical protein
VINLGNVLTRFELIAGNSDAMRGKANAAPTDSWTRQASRLPRRMTSAHASRTRAAYKQRSDCRRDDGYARAARLIEPT